MTLTAPEIPVIASVKDLGSGYSAWLVDIWGVMHNGHRAFAPAVDATRSFREQGGMVVFLSNSPRPSPGVQEQLSRLGVPPSSYDATVTSGDLTRHELRKHKHPHVFHLGPERDLPIFAGLDLTLVSKDKAELIVCSGLFDDETETPEDYAGLLKELAAKKLPMICANPDHLVERGDKLVYCAGALAAIYEQMGGNVVYAGKPHAPIYELAQETIAGVAGRAVTKDEMLAIGDGVHTDVAGAAGFGIDSVFVASGLHAPANSGGEAGAEALDRAHLAELFGAAKRRPLAAMRALAW
ncbi:MAG TPA: TIGR01459 family HAD-type hydrolase [Methyloceanibacter sp.]|nr:TIGR01459 family HAD-type hydrolase [Methyloceanibacter sp.]